MEKTNDKNTINRLLFICMFIPILFFPKVINNDFYFIFKHGEYVVQHGIPTVEPFTMHKDLHFVMQQWLSAVIYYLISHYLGDVAVLVFVSLIYAVCIWICYKTLVIISDNELLSSFLVAVSFFLLAFFTQTRPMAISYICMLLVLYSLVKYTKTNDRKVLLFLPAVSLLQINIQCSMWIFLFIIILPFLFERIIFTNNNIYCDFYDRKPLYVAILLMIFAGLINPYGIKAMTYVFHSIQYNKALSIGEMSSASLFNPGGILIILSIIVLTIVSINANGKCNIRYIFFYWGSVILVFFAIRNVPYIVFAFALLLSDLMKNVDFEKWLRKKLNHPERSIMIIVIAIILIGAYFTAEDFIKEDKDNAYPGIDYLVDNYKVDDETTIYTGYNDGCYAIYKDLKVYLDTRMEVYLKSQNGQFDYIDEYCDLQNKKIDYKDFLNKYKFDYLLLCNWDVMYQQIDRDCGYEKIYEDDYCEIYKRINGQ